MSDYGSIPLPPAGMRDSVESPVPTAGGLSETMVKAIRMARDGGLGRLHRWPGGYWVGRPREAEERAVLGKYAATQTIQALIDRGYFRAIAHLSRGDPWIVEITERAP